MRGRLLVALLAVVIVLAESAEAQTKARGLGVNIPLLGRLIGGGNVLFLTAIDVSNHSTLPAQVDFYIDGVSGGATVVLNGSISAAGAVVRQGAGGLMRARSTAHFDDFVDALVVAGLIPASARADGFLGSVLFVFDGQAVSGRGSATARFYNRFGDGFVGVSLRGRDITTREPQSLVASVQDTRGNTSGAQQIYPNMFINNTGLTPNGGGTAGPVTIEVSAISNSTGQAVGVPLTIDNLGPGQVASIGQVLTALQVPAGESIILVFVRVVSGNAAIQGIISQVDAITRDGAVFEMSRADF